MTDLRTTDGGANSRDTMAIRLNQLLNDPDVEMEPDMIWELLGELKAAAGGRITLAPRLPDHSSKLQRAKM